MQRAAADEDRERAKERLFLGREHVIGPAQRLVQRLLARRRISSTSRQHLEARFQSVEQGLGRQHFTARGCQLDRQRHTLQPRTEFGDGARVLYRQLEARQDGLRPLHKECYRGHMRKVIVCWQVAQIRHFQRRDREFIFAPYMQARPAGHEELELRTGREQFSEEGSCRQHLLEGIEQYHELLVA